MKYTTTRDNSQEKTFAEIICLSNASCGGLYIPLQLPNLKNSDFTDLSYGEIAEKIIGIFTEIPHNDIVDIVEKSLKNFEIPEVFATKNLNENLKIVELFHGPTLSFKDYPMQFLGNIIEYILSKSGKQLNILTATSGDTGSAALHAFANKENIKIVVLHPKERVTEFQRKQMTTCDAKNVLNIAIDGTFDDCQAIVKEITNSQLAKEKNISTVNSINWGRIMMQMVYYIKLLENEQDANIFVPTGNFGNIFACYFLKKCGFEGVGKMFISNNANNIISNAYQTGILQNKKSVATISPAIDIAIPSNFERMLFLESGLNSSKIAEIYMQIKSGSAELSTQIWQNFKNYFDAKSITDGETLSAIKKCYDDFGYILDPHAAVAYAHFGHSGVKNGIIMATAHPCKFEDAVFDAIGVKSQIPKSNAGVMEKAEKLEFSSSENAKDVILGFFG